MIFPWQLSLRLAGYLGKNGLRRRKRFPLVLMLEPTFRCNLSCAGCGRIRENRDIMDRMLSADECLDAVDEAGAPVVSITGGEPLLHPDIRRIVAETMARKRFVHLCTNGLLLSSSLEKFKPSPYLSFVVHLDGLAQTHDGIAGRKGVFDIAVEGIRAAKRAGFQVRTNTTVFKATSTGEIEKLFLLLSQLKVDGIMIAPGFSYGAVDGDVFLSRKEISETLAPIYGLRKKFRFYNTPVYLEFLAGKRQLACSPWSNPTRDPRGWKQPCYLITDGHCRTFKELMEQTQWDSYGVGHDPRCANCMVHSGFEASALGEAGKSLDDMWRMVKWDVFGN
ncbi:MAG: adenosyl-hopene transferase HpnH [Dehalococcoidia bacterium]|nr:adenosyl-hopene transferase HpnH [Dehalococcoidia bacterium]